MSTGYILKDRSPTPSVTCCARATSLREEGSKDALFLVNYDMDNSQYYVNGGDAYGIYCDGDLNIVLRGTSYIRPDICESDTAYGIFCDGALTITNDAGMDGTLNVSLGLLNGTAAPPKETAGIRCNPNDVYYLTIQKNTAKTGGSLTVNATALPAAGENCSSSGIYAGYYMVLTSCTVNATGGTATGNYARSCGIRCRCDYQQHGGVVQAGGGEGHRP